jgi:hypothetical protein
VAGAQISGERFEGCNLNQRTRVRTRERGRAVSHRRLLRRLGGCLAQKLSHYSLVVREKCFFQSAGVSNDVAEGLRRRARRENEGP